MRLSTIKKKKKHSTKRIDYVEDFFVREATTMIKKSKGIADLNYEEASFLYQENKLYYHIIINPMV